MGLPAIFEGANKVFTAPPGRDDVQSLPVFSNGTCIVSSWQLSDAEIKEIVRTRRVFLSVFSGDVLYPVYVGAESAVRGVVVDYGKVWGMTAPKYPINIDTKNWGLFDPDDFGDAACERERMAFTEYVVRRVQKAVKKQNSDEAAITTGSIMAIVQIVYAVHANSPPDAARDALHQCLDYAWLMCSTMTDGVTQQ